jgi:CYTH domain-containing protein
METSNQTADQKKGTAMAKSNTETEAKYVVLCRNGELPSDKLEAHLEQSYLNVPEGSGIERRVREWTEDGVTRYFLATKAPTGVEGQRKENEKEISRLRYVLLLMFCRDRACQPVIKTRYTFWIDGQKHEYDVYDGHLKGLETLEMETDSVDKLRALVPPNYLQYRRVTEDKRYSNRSLAEHGIPKL